MAMLLYLCNDIITPLVYYELATHFCAIVSPPHLRRPPWFYYIMASCEKVFAE